MIAPGLVERLRGALDRNSALDLLRRAVAVPSVTGNEADFAGLLAEELRALGTAGVTIREFAPGRPNVHGILRGRGDGPLVLLTGHTDTVHVRGWAERWRGTERHDPFGGAVVDGAVWGRGTGDLKAGISTALAAARLLAAAGIEPAADILFAFVGDEESGEPGTGVSAGMKALMAEFGSGSLPRPDSPSMSSPRASKSSPPRWDS